MVRPISSELMSVWITGDGKTFADEKDAINHQNIIIHKEKKNIEDKISLMEEELKVLNNAE